MWLYIQRTKMFEKKLWLLLGTTIVHSHGYDGGFPFVIESSEHHDECFSQKSSAINCLVCAPAKYFSQAWCQSAHTRKSDTQLNEAMGAISARMRFSTDLLPFWYLAAYYSKKHSMSTAISQSMESQPSATWIPARTTCSRQIPLATLLKIVHGEPREQRLLPPPVPASVKPYLSSFTNSPPTCDTSRKVST